MAAVAPPDPVRKRLKTLFLIAMTSEHEGERQNAMAVFTRTLKEHGITPHDVANGVLDGAAPPPPPPTRQEPPAPKSSLVPAYRLSWADWEIDGGELIDLLRRIAARYKPAPGTFDYDFLTGMEQRALGFDVVGMSQKQLDIFKRFMKRVPS